MTFEEILDQAVAMLQRHGRLTYGTLKRQFHLDDAALDDLKEQLLYAHPQVVDDPGRGVVWTGETAGSPTAAPPPSRPLPPAPPRAPQAVPPPQTAPLPAPSPPREAERRQLTVLFCDLVGSTTLSAQLDPEDLREVVRAYQRTCAEVIQGFDGYIAQYLGDGLLVYFGYPQAHEDDAQRAVRTGLGIVEAMGTLNTRLAQDTGICLAVRIGIHTGLVVVGEMGSGERHEHLALGDTPNLAAGIQGLAAPDTIVISEATSRLVQGYFMCRDFGTRLLKGIDTPVRVAQVVGESAEQSRLDVARVTGLTPLVGREAEVTLLRERWAQSTEGLGQAVLLRGEAGIGKSRLIHVLTECVVDAGVLRLTLRCSPYHTNSAFYPVIDHLQRLTQGHHDASPEARLAILEQALQTAGLPLAEAVPLLAALLSLPVPERYPPLPLSPQRQKQKTQEALVAWLLAETVQQPVLAVWEDLHWADPSTLELLGLLLDQIPTTRLLMVLTGRPEFRPPWTPRSYVTPLTLTRLTRPQIEEMVLRVTGGKSLPTEVVQQIVAKTDGIPLFVEELVKTILEAGLVREDAGHYVLTGPLPPLAIPATLQDALTARLDRLAAVKDVAQLGAVLGREFAYVLLRAVAPMDEPTLQYGLAQLVEAELLYQHGLRPQATYLFKHALLQDAAYQSLLRSTRQQYHARIAHVLEAQFPETATTQPELLAHHYTEAGLTAQAIPYWQRAGQRALERSANLEAVAHLTKGLEVLATLPDTPERAQQELEMQLTLGPALITTKGQASPEVLQAYARARELCQQVGETPQLFQVLRGLWYFYLHRMELQTARELGEHLLILAQQVGDSALLLEAHSALGNTLNYLGELTASQAHFAQGLALYDPQQHRAHAFRYGRDPGVVCRYYASVTLWWLGYPDQALQRSHEVLTLARELAHLYSLASALFFATWVHQFRREWPLTQERAEATIDLGAEQGAAVLVAGGTIFRGWALAQRYAELGAGQGQREEGMAQMQQGLAAWHATGAAVVRPYGLALLAEAYAQVGRCEEGLTLLAEALALINDREERRWEAELYRLQGELLLVHSAAHHAEAETCFRHALDVARHQQAKSWELRAAMSLSRLWQQQGKHDAACELLAPIYGWFTEGFDTADLKEAKALLDALQ
jgi:class 3 adenylate cyclase/predicted ATPase